MNRLLIFLFLSLSVNLFAQNTLEVLNNQLIEAREAKDFKSLAETYLAIGIFEDDHYKNHEKAFDYYTRSQEYFKIIQDSAQYFHVKQRIGNHFRLTGQYDEALDNYNEVIKYLKRNPNNESVLASCYLDASILYANNDDIDMQSKYLDSIKMIEGIGKDTLSSILYNFEKIRYFESVFELDSADVLSVKTLELSELINHDYFKGKALYHLGFFSSKRNNNKSAIDFYSKATKLLEKESLDPIKLNVFRELSKAYEKKSDFKMANDYIKKYSTLNDSILNRERIEAINNLSFKYETREKNTAIKLLEQENLLVQNVNEQQKRALYVLGAGLALLAVSLYFIIQFFRQRIKAARIIDLQRDKIDKQKIKDLENEVKISSMQSVIEGQELERERIAKDLHDSLGGLLSAVKLQFEKVRTDSHVKGTDFDNAQNLLDTAVDEVRSISRNLQPGSLKNMGLVAAINDLVNRYVGEAYPDIDFQHYNIPRDLDNLLATSIYRIIQELLNNAIKYAKANEILIQLNKEEEDIIISFEDDGVGFNSKSFEKGMGLENVQSRVKYLKGDLQIDSQENVGTSYLIHVKIDNA